MKILGLSSFAHESSACVISDDRIESLIEEERLNRQRHTWQYPSKSIQACLDRANLNIHNIDHFAFFWNPSKEITGNVGHVLKYFPASLNLLKSQSGGSDLKTLERLRLMKKVGNNLRKQFALPVALKVYFIDHHMAHAASCFYPSEFEDAAILTIDGRGESISTLLAVGNKNTITKIASTPVPHSLGHLYAAITAYLGFTPFFDEWKVMGASAYGKEGYVEEFRKLIHWKNNGTFRLNLKYFKFHTHGQACWLSDEFFKIFGPLRKPQDSFDQRHFDIALGLQKLIEESGVRLANYLYEKTRLPNLCMSGGVVLNCLMNSRIIRETKFEHFFFQPIANDAGTSLGSALYLKHQILKQPRTIKFDSIYLGPAFDDDVIKQALKNNGLQFEKLSDVTKMAAQFIADGKIVGWFQGRMEAGPRALGNRSILADPRHLQIKDKVNRLVKHRESFRPFAPSVLEERVHEFFDMPKKQLSPHMMLIGKVKPEKKIQIPAVIHVDGTARVQTVSQSANPLFWKLIKEFEKLSGIPIVLNTSFNDQEPIVCSPEDAIQCFRKGNLDALIINHYVVKKHV